MTILHAQLVDYLQTIPCTERHLPKTKGNQKNVRRETNKHF